MVASYDKRKGRGGVRLTEEDSVEKGKNEYKGCAQSDEVRETMRMLPASGVATMSVMTL